MDEELQEQTITNKFLQEDTLGLISQVLVEKKELGSTAALQQTDLDSLLMPPPGTPGRTPGRTNASVFSAFSPGVSLKGSVEEYLNPSLPATTSSHASHQEEKAARSGEEEEEDKDEELDITDIDDEEIDSYIMSSAEIKQKTKLWMTINAEYLKEQEEKIKREKEEREELIKQGKDPDKKRRVVKRKVKGTLGSHGSAIEAIEKIAQEKKISTKINYDVLKSLSSPSSSPAKIEGAAAADTATASPILARVSQGLSSLRSVSLPLKRPLATSPLAATTTDSNKRSRLSDSKAEPSPSPSLSSSSSSRLKPNLTARKAKDDRLSTTTSAAAAATDTRLQSSTSCTSSLVVESGPVEEESPEDFDEEEEAEELSAAQLLSRHFGGDGGGYGEEEEYY